MVVIAYYKLTLFMLRMYSYLPINATLTSENND